MAIDQMTLAEETAPPQDIQKLLKGLESGKFYAPDESPWAGDFSDFFKLAQKIKARKKFEEYPELYREEYIAGAPYATTPRHWTQNLIPDLQDMRSLWTFGTGGGDMAMELAGLTPGSKAGIMGLAAIRNTPKIIHNMPKSVYNKHKIALETGKGGSRMGLDYLSHMDPKFAVERILAPALGSLKKARKYEYAITSEGKHYFKHKETGRYKVIPATRQEIADPKTLMLPDLRIGTKAYAQRNRKNIKRQKEIAKDADLMKVRKQRLQTEAAADDLFQLRDTTLPPEVRAATLERYKEYPEAVKQEAMKLLDDIGGPAGGSGAGLPSLIGHQRYHNYGMWEDIPLNYRTGNSRLTEKFLQRQGFEEMSVIEGGRAAAAKLPYNSYEVLGDGKRVVLYQLSGSPAGKVKVTQKTFNDPTLEDLFAYFGY
jgi:hypothetical protein